MRPRVPVEQRFWRFVTPGAPDECWEFGGARTTGYGVLGRGPRSEGLILAHRLSYEMHVGPIPDGLHIDHLCRNRACVNPAHLEAVTQAENNRRAHAAATPLTHCKRGHEFTEENTYRYPHGGRNCKECKRVSDREAMRRRRAALKVTA